MYWWDGFLFSSDGFTFEGERKTLRSHTTLLGQMAHGHVADEDATTRLLHEGNPSTMPFLLEHPWSQLVGQACRIRQFERRRALLCCRC